MTVFDDILAKGVRAGQIPGRSASARKWYRGAAEALASNTIGNTSPRMHKQFAPGNMYMFWYDPKHKATLPYYDRFPLIFPLGPAPGGFYGINFHYLPPRLRAKLMDALYKLASNDQYDESTKMNLNYKLLKSIARVKYYKPTVKHYLNKHVKSNFIYIFPSEWDIALFLDTQRFEKATTARVWQDSQNMINGVKTDSIKKSSVSIAGIKV